MEIVRLKAGEEAPADTDCIKVEPSADGKFNLVTSTLDGAESVAMVQGGPYESAEQAEEAGLAWAAGHGATTVYVERA